MPEPDDDGLRRVLVDGVDETVVMTGRLARELAGATSFELRWRDGTGRVGSSTQEQPAPPPTDSPVMWEAVAVLVPHTVDDCPRHDGEPCRSNATEPETVYGSAGWPTRHAHALASQVACVDLLRRLGATVTTTPAP